MSKHTALYSEHLDLGGKFLDFAGWEMPLNYGSQIEEHHAVRRNAGAFDVSHMTVIDVFGEDALAWLQLLIANDVGVLKEGQAQYGLLLNQEAGIIDDLISYRRGADYRLVVNAGACDKVLAWLDQQAGTHKVDWIHRMDLSIIAVQGPRAILLFKEACGIDGSALSAFSFFETPGKAKKQSGWMIARTGYTGEQGLEVILPQADAPGLWRSLMSVGIKAVGLAARDTLRLEAGMNLSGQDMDESTHALESNLGWTIAWQPSSREFIGRDALESVRKSGCPLKLTGVVMEGRGVLRHGQKIVGKSGYGIITSGIFSPVLGYSVGLARVPKSIENNCEVEIRGKRFPVKLVKPPFVRNGQKVYQ
ncbi:MAG: glycine cleavage system aminomethyltransferase GcvT [Pseudomonadales bacterium]|nr:glycine cleavage system aminomethyltransferase GcvT [Pseudomonadales bacterium]